VLRDRIEDKARAPAETKRVRVVALQDLDEHKEGEKFEVARGRELQKMITLGWVRIDDSNDAGA
jgi:hypothetical protein